MPNWQSELDYRRREVHSRKEGVWDIQTTFMLQWKDNWFSSEFHDDASRRTSPLLHDGGNSIDLRGPSDQTIFFHSFFPAVLWNAKMIQEKSAKCTITLEQFVRTCYQKFSTSHWSNTDSTYANTVNEFSVLLKAAPLSTSCFTCHFSMFHFLGTHIKQAWQLTVCQICTDFSAAASISWQPRETKKITQSVFVFKSMKYWEILKHFPFFRHKFDDLFQIWIRRIECSRPQQINLIWQPSPPNWIIIIITKTRSRQ